MKTLELLRSLGLNDLRLARRDSLLRWMLFVPFLYAILVMTLLPYLAQRLQDVIDLRVYDPLILGFLFLSATPVLYGMVGGFLLLDERDDHTLMALRVSPVPVRDLLLFRMMLPAVVSAIVCIALIGILAEFPVHWGALILASTLSALEVPLVAFFLASSAENKVQGFALLKIMSVFLWGPVIAAILGFPLGWVFAILPNFWPLFTLLWGTESLPHALMCFMVGLIYHALLYAIMIRRFQAKVLSA